MSFGWIPICLAIVFMSFVLGYTIDMALLKIRFEVQKVCNRLDRIATALERKDRPC